MQNSNAMEMPLRALADFAFAVTKIFELRSVRGSATPTISTEQAVELLALDLSELAKENGEYLAAWQQVGTALDVILDLDGVNGGDPVAREEFRTVLESIQRQLASALRGELSRTSGLRARLQAILDSWEAKVGETVLAQQGPPGFASRLRDQVQQVGEMVEALLAELEANVGRLEGLAALAEVAGWSEEVRQRVQARNAELRAESEQTGEPAYWGRPSFEHPDG